jgi:hypothetical protein
MSEGSGSDLTHLNRDFPVGFMFMLIWGDFLGFSLRVVFWQGLSRSAMPLFLTHTSVRCNSDCTINPIPI